MQRRSQWTAGDTRLNFWNSDRTKMTRGPVWLKMKKKDNRNRRGRLLEEKKSFVPARKCIRQSRCTGNASWSHYSAVPACLIHRIMWAPPLHHTVTPIFPQNNRVCFFFFYFLRSEKPSRCGVSGISENPSDLHLNQLLCLKRRHSRFHTVICCAQCGWLI